MKHSRTRCAWKLGGVFIALALLISLVISAGLLFHARSLPAALSTTPTTSAKPLTPTPASVPSIYPKLAGTYIGTIVDISVNAGTSMSLSRIRQSKGNISGYLFLGLKIQGSGPFSGTIDTAKHLQFTVTDTKGDALLFFEGAMQSATNLAGDYYRCSHLSLARESHCIQTPGSYGIWDVIPASSHLDRHLKATKNILALGLQSIGTRSLEAPCISSRE